MDNTPESFENNNDKKTDAGKQKQWGGVYIVLGIAGLAFSIYSILHYFDALVPLFGTVIAGVLIGALSILIIIYGYRLIKRDY